MSFTPEVVTMEETNGNILVMKGIYKSFPGVQALENVDFSLKRGEIHALVGENGAGKSTLIKVMTGVERFDKGSFYFDGEEPVIKSPQQAQDLGISTVYQEVNLCTNLSVAENILIGREPHKFMRIDWKKVNEQASEILKGLEVNIDVTQQLGAYSTAIQQITAIARALVISNAKVLILDEPTSSLDSFETAQLFGIMNKLRDDGVSIIFITHFLDQVYEVSDRITVLRNGKLVGTYETSSLSNLELISKMIGRSLAEYDAVIKTKQEIYEQISGDSILKAENLGKSGTIHPFDIEIHKGEVVGLAGLLGSGRSEIAKLIFGIDKPDKGSLSINNKKVKQYSPRESLDLGIALCPEDRKHEGIFGELTIRENIIMALQARLGWFKFISPKKQYEIADNYIKLLNIITPSPDQAVKNLSGGNQQKVILARWLATDPNVFILDEPTRGIDVGAKAEIQKLVLALADEGKACIFISSELEEVMRTSHRITVLRDREVVAEFNSDEDEHLIMQAMAGSSE
ncbi:MAG: sugar ABC transporter ATP-binding protein [Anaerolineales bacterium]|nr:sugar ABC transporter ATP-binding protein [Anaerolineales bacterium]